MKEIDAWKTLFKIEFRIYEWVVMPFGLTNSLVTFMKLFNDLFRLWLGCFVIIYLDDNLIFNKTWDVHVLHLHQVLDILCVSQLQVKLKKPVFSQCSASYLGFLFLQKELG